MRIYITRLKCLLRNKGNIFWAIFFPLCLGTFFYLGFGSLSYDNILETVDVYVAKDASSEQLVNQMKDVDIDKDNPLFNVNIKYTKIELEEHLHDNKITGYIYVENEIINYRINDNGLDQTITKTFLDQYLQIGELMIKVSTTDPAKVDDVTESLMNSKDYLEEVMTGTNPKANKTVIYFYALIAMACMYAGFWGNLLVKDIQADSSPIAARVNITPTHKLKLIFIYFLAALTVHFIGNLGLIGYLRFILKVEFSNDIGLIILSSFVGTVGGIAIGAFLAAIITGSPAKKEGIINLISLLLSFLSGLMFIDIKYLVSKYLPVLAYINPANLLTETFYSLYYYDDINRYFQYLGILGIISVIMLLGTYMKLRGNKYDSI